jgi:hypothetical protein
VLDNWKSYLGYPAGALDVTNPNQSPGCSGSLHSIGKPPRAGLIEPSEYALLSLARGYALTRPVLQEWRNTQCSGQSRIASASQRSPLGGTALGAGAGAVVGAATGSPEAGAAIGGALGALGGATLGNELITRERTEHDTRLQLQRQQQALEEQRREIERLKMQREVQ